MAITSEHVATFRLLVNDPLGQLSEQLIIDFLSMATDRAMAELPYRAAATFMMSRGDPNWKDALTAFAPTIEAERPDAAT